MEGIDQKVHKSGKERKQTAREIMERCTQVVRDGTNNKQDDDISDQNDQIMDFTC